MSRGDGWPEKCGKGVLVAKTSPRRVWKQEGHAGNSPGLFLTRETACFKLTMARGGTVDGEPTAGAIWHAEDIKEMRYVLLGDLRARER